MDWIEITGNMHMHTPYSDGVKWHAEIADDALTAGLDFIIVTDHNILVDGVQGYYENENGRLLLLTGEEIHNVRRNPEASHCLVYGAEREMVQYAANPQRLIDEVNMAGGSTFLAHPHEDDIPIFDYPNLGWHDWDIDGYTGLEIWNYMTGFKNRLTDAFKKLPVQSKLLAGLTAVYMSRDPNKYVTGPEQATLDFWDAQLAKGKHMAAIGGSDAHGQKWGFGPLRRIIYPYEFLFRTVNTHLLIPEPLGDDYRYDQHLVLRAMRHGNAWVGYDLVHPTHGFRFYAHGTHTATMGERLEMKGQVTLETCLPTDAHIRLIRHGEVVAEVTDGSYLNHTTSQTGAYRVESYLPFEGQPRGWIYSNPIYIN